MPAQRPPKRQRKKDAAAARRAAMLEMMQKRRRQRIIMLSTVTVLLVGGGALAVIVSGGGKPAKPAATPKPTPTLAPTPAPIACGGTLPEAAGSKKPTFPKADDQKLNPKKTYIWHLETSCGVIEVKLATVRSPKTANSIVFLTKKGFYDGLTFHRMVKDFVIQGGDPQGTGSGGPGYSVTEAPAKTEKYTKGVVAMAKTGQEAAGTSGSQFFIVTGPGAGSLTPDYAILGDVSAGMDVVDKINGLSAGEGPPPVKVFIEKATIIEQ